jgi:hypothetical protein
MSNEYMHKVLEERLQILDILESLVTQAPDLEYYEETLSDFGLSTTSNGMVAHLDYLTKNDIAVFILPSSINEWTFWDSPVRIRDIKPEKLRAMRHSVREQLVDLTETDSADSANDATQDGEKGSYALSADSRPGGLAMFVGIMGFIATVSGVIIAVSSWRLLNTDLARTFVVVGLVILAVALARLTVRLRAGELAWRQALDMTVVGALCICGTLALTTVFGPAKLPTLRFAPVQMSQSLQCRVFQGTGIIPHGLKLMIFDSTAKTGDYFWDGDASNYTNFSGWQTKLINAGNDPTWISAVLVSPSLHRYIASIFFADKKRPHLWLSAHLPPGLEAIPPIEVSPVENRIGCAGRK